MTPALSLLERQPRHETATPRSWPTSSTCSAAWRPSRASRPPAAQLEQLSGTELRVLRYLPSNLSASEIATELYVSTSTVKTHMRHIYEKLDAHRRTDAVERARDLGLLAPPVARGR